MGSGALHLTSAAHQRRLVKKPLPVWAHPSPPADTRARPALPVEMTFGNRSKTNTWRGGVRHGPIKLEAEEENGLEKWSRRSSFPPSTDLNSIGHGNEFWRTWNIYGKRGRRREENSTAQHRPRGHEPARRALLGLGRFRQFVSSTARRSEPRFMDRRNFPGSFAQQSASSLRRPPFETNPEIVRMMNLVSMLRTDPFLTPF